MRTLTRNEAREWLETHNIEDAMIFGVVERGFRFTFKACIEKREGIDDNDEKEFPEGCELIEYAKGSGWDATTRRRSMSITATILTCSSGLRTRAFR